MQATTQTLEQLLRVTLIHLAAGAGHLRLLAIGAPFAAELIQLTEDDLRAALDATREAEAIREAVTRSLSGAPQLQVSDRP